MENAPDSPLYKLILTVPFVIGVAGNIAALCILYYTKKRRNAKHVLLLRCLAANDLVSELGMLTVTYMPNTYDTYAKCVFIVLLRAFGLGSGCIAFVMAVERWLALTKPFFYQQHVTYWVLVRSVATIWFAAVLITYIPLYSNYGLFYKGDECKNYKEAEKEEDIIYAYIFFTFGVTICTVIAYCNSMVFWELSRLGSRRKHLVRRTSRSTMNNTHPVRDNCKVYSTSEERAFATVMAFLGVIFVVCWMPQMILIPLAQFDHTGPTYTVLSKIAKVLMCIYFTVDPYVYVFKHYIDRRKFRLPFKRSSSSTAHGSTQAGTPTSVLVSAPSFTATNV